MSPTPIVDAYTQINAREAYGEFVPSPSPKSPPTVSQSIRSALVRAAESTPPLGKSVTSAIARASSLARSEKTKNSSNKNKERTSIAGSIIRMLERMDSSSGGGDMAAAMNMMMMRQMDAMARSMERREREDKRERARDRKRRRKRRAKREAKRRVLQASMEDLDDHGGKGPEFSVRVVHLTVLAAAAVTDIAAKTAGTGRDSGDARRLGRPRRRRLRKMIVQPKGKMQKK